MDAKPKQLTFDEYQHVARKTRTFKAQLMTRFARELQRVDEDVRTAASDGSSSALHQQAKSALNSAVRKLDDFFARYEVAAVSELESKMDIPELAPHYLVEGLTAQIGEIANRLKKKLRDGGDYVLIREEIEERIGYALWYIAALADELGANLSKIALKNIEFNERRWEWYTAEAPEQPNDFDAGFPPNERLPNRLMAEFKTGSQQGLKKTSVWIYPDWPNRKRRRFGDPIDDNSTSEDYYRYHDIFHFAYMGLLWWSPVVRKLLKCKRKSNQDIDRIEDGARARDTEEAVTAFIYSYVSQQKYLETSNAVDTGLLTAVRTLLRNFEVKACSEKEWQEVILTASETLRALFANQGGWVEINRSKRTVRYLGRATPRGGFQITDDLA